MNERRAPLLVIGLLAACCVGCSSEPETTPATTGTPAMTGSNGSQPSAATGTAAAQPAGSPGNSSQTPASDSQPAPVKPPAAPNSGMLPTSNGSMAQAGASAAPANLDPSQPLGQIPAQCRGFEVLGLEHSPGGSTLPNTCAPFDGTLNNPYAIRCVDADPSYETKYPGDAYCILPPPETLGTQIHVGPADNATPGEFELAGGAEISNFYYVNAPNSEVRYFYRTNWRMRPGGHHMLIAMLDQDQADGWTARGDMGSDFSGRGKSFGGAQRGSVDRPQGVLAVPPENAGLGQQLAARQQFSLNLHHINVTDLPMLREVWINVWYVNEQEVTKPVLTFAGTGNPADVAVPAGQRRRLEYKCAVTSDTRIISLYGHYHAHGQRFGIAVVRASGERLSVYESFDWEDIPVYQYDSLSRNPLASVDASIDGAASGLLMLKSGDALHFECNIDNDSDQALRFVDEAITGEMCIMFGAYTGANPCGSVQRVQ
jgi:hypothetical protein